MHTKITTCPLCQKQAPQYWANACEECFKKMPFRPVNPPSKRTTIYVEISGYTADKAAYVFTTDLVLPKWKPYIQDTKWEPDSVRQALLYALMESLDRTQSSYFLEEVEQRPDGSEVWQFGT